MFTGGVFSIFSQFEYKDATYSTGMCISVLVNSFVTVLEGIRVKIGGSQYIYYLTK